VAAKEPTHQNQDTATLLIFSIDFMAQQKLDAPSTVLAGVNYAGTVCWAGYQARSYSSFPMIRADLTISG
jgi:hypothetical protein